MKKRTLSQQILYQLGLIVGDTTAIKLHLEQLNGTVAELKRTQADHENRLINEEKKDSYNKGKTNTLKYLVTILLAVAAIIVTYLARQ